ncbi:MAG TPA: TRL domain-containing protein [Polyangiaceae bacterium]|jgi:hypothetical protein
MRTALPLVLSSLVVVAVAAGTVGCTVLGYPTGSIYTGTKVPHGAMRLEGSGAGKGGTARGEACATGILGMVAFGDASLAAAKKAGGIADVQSVEFGGLSILGIYTKGCTIAYGPASPLNSGGGGGGGAGDGDGGGDGAAAGSRPGKKDPGSGKPSEPGAPGPGGPMSGGPGGGGGGPPKGPGAGGPSSDRGGGEPPRVAGVPFTPVGFSFMWDEPVTHDQDHQCITYDPTQPSDPNPFPAAKEEFDPKNHAWRGHFVDRCPTENVIATCDHRRSRQMMTFYYKGKTPGDLHVAQKVYCALPIFRGVWTWVVPPEPVAKPPASNGPIAFACDNQNTLQCQTFRPDMDPKKLDEQKRLCTMMQGKVADHCPSAGLTGRCEEPATGVTTYRYQSNADLLWPTCDKNGGKWSAP